MIRLFIPQCGAELIPTDMIWSERRSGYHVRNVWSCEACGYQYEQAHVGRGNGRTPL